MYLEQKTWILFFLKFIYKMVLHLFEVSRGIKLPWSKFINAWFLMKCEPLMIGKNILSFLSHSSQIMRHFRNSFSFITVNQFSNTIAYWGAPWIFHGLCDNIGLRWTVAGTSTRRPTPQWTSNSSRWGCSSHGSRQSTTSSSPSSTHSTHSSTSTL